MPISKNLSMLTDFYEFTMANGYLKEGIADTIAYFDMFFRNVPDNGGYAVMAGVEQLVDYINNLHFDEEDIQYLRSKEIFCEEFLDYMKNFNFSCDIWAAPEGSPIFPGEPVVTVRGPIMQAQFIETMVLLTINHQSLIATKASRMVHAAGSRSIMEFGSRRAQGADGAVLGARAAYIAGCAATACVLCERDYGVPTAGTMAHSWVQLFDSEYQAFCAYANAYPNSCVLLIDTYNVLKSGVPNAIKVAKQVLEPQGQRLRGIRIDSGDMAYLSKRVRAMLDEAGMQDCKITVSNSLDEFLIRDLLSQGAQIDSFGIGERLITSKSAPVFGGVYKLAAIGGKDGSIIPKIKISENVEKITTPHFKKVWRLVDNDSGKYIADVLTVFDEVIEADKPYVLFDANHTWKRKTVQNFTAFPLLEQIFEKGNCVFEKRPIQVLRTECAQKLDALWSEVRRFENPQIYYVDLSQKLWEIKNELLQKF